MFVKDRLIPVLWMLNTQVRACFIIKQLNTLLLSRETVLITGKSELAFTGSYMLDKSTGHKMLVKLTGN